MKRIITSLLLVAALCYVHTVNAQGVAVNTTGTKADTSAIFDAASSTKGLLVPRMDSIHRMSIVTPAKGLIIYQTDSLNNGLYIYNGSTWQKAGYNVQPHVKAYTTPGGYTFTTSSYISTATLFKITVVGAGGGGGGAEQYDNTGGGGGGAGANGIYWASGLSPNTSYSVFVGYGGYGGYENGGSGTSSSVTLSAGAIACSGGLGGTYSSSGGSAGNGGTSTGGTLNISGGPGAPGAGTSGNNIGGNGGSSAYGSGGYGIPAATYAYSASNGSGNGSGGGGGGGQYYFTYGGNGANGIVVIEWSE